MIQLSLTSDTLYLDTLYPETLYLGMFAGWNPGAGIVFHGRSFSGIGQNLGHKKLFFSPGNSGNCQLVIRSIILVITLVLICIHIANFGIFFSHDNEKLEKEEASLKSMLTEPNLPSPTLTNDNLEVSFTYHVL